MPQTELTPGIKHDLQLINMRDIIDTKRLYRKSRNDELPKYFQMGTIVEDAFSYARHGRTAPKPVDERHGTLVQELLADTEKRQEIKRRYTDVQRQIQARGKYYYRFTNTKGKKK